jgi:hypothetical protein
VRLAYTSPFTVGALAVYVFGSDHTVTGALGFDSLQPPWWFEESFVRLWPASERLVLWPEKTVLTFEYLTAMQSWVGMDISPDGP